MSLMMAFQFLRTDNRNECLDAMLLEVPDRYRYCCNMQFEWGELLYM